MIGYFIEEAYRGHSYAFRAALLLLEIARQKGQNYVTISCEVGNAASTDFPGIAVKQNRPSNQNTPFISLSRVFRT